MIKEFLAKGVGLVTQENLAMMDSLEKLDWLVSVERLANQALKGSEGRKDLLDHRELRVQEVRLGIPDLWVFLVLRVIAANWAS